MINKPVKYKKLRKFLRDPNMFFYDMFRKRVFKDASPEALEKTSSNSLTSGSNAAVDLLEINRLGLLNYIRKNLNAGVGPEDGSDPNSLLIWSGYLNGLIGFIAGLKEATPTDVTIYTLGGGYSITSKAKARFDAKAISKSLSSRPDFVVELCNPLGALHILHIYLYDLEPTGLATIRSNRAWLRKFPVSEFDNLFNAPTEPQASGHIDAVYTWVNHADENWQEYWISSFPDEEFDADRYTSNDELRYSLRSLNKYAPWIHKIYIVSNCSKPNWLNDFDKIIWVKHEEIFPDLNVLPTFSSHAIETCLHRIPDLSEQFIYLNDDFVLGQPCLPSDFFDETGRSLAYFESYGMVDSTENIENIPDYLVAAKNSKRLIKQRHSSYEARNLHRHVPYSLKKSLLEELETEYPTAFQLTREAKRRSVNDINLTSFLYHHYAYAKGHAVKADAPGLIVRPENIDAVVGKDSYKYKILCFNDGNGSAGDSEYKNSTNIFFGKRLGEPAPWEAAPIAIYTEN